MERAARDFHGKDRASMRQKLHGQLIQDQGSHHCRGVQARIDQWLARTFSAQPRSLAGWT